MPCGGGGAKPNNNTDTRIIFAYCTTLPINNKNHEINSER